VKGLLGTIGATALSVQAAAAEHAIGAINAAAPEVVAAEVVRQLNASHVGLRRPL